jgi:hypothetical protein
MAIDLCDVEERRSRARCEDRQRPRRALDPRSRTPRIHLELLRQRAIKAARRGGRLVGSTPLKYSGLGLPRNRHTQFRHSAALSLRMLMSRLCGVAIRPFREAICKSITGVVYVTRLSFPSSPTSSLRLSPRTSRTRRSPAQRVGVWGQPVSSPVKRTVEN